MLSDLFPVVERPESLSDNVYRTLVQAIVEGKLAPGQIIRQTQMAETLGVSRTPVRDAFKRLEQQRLLRCDASGMYYVAEWGRQTLWEIATLRAALEGLALSLAQESLSQEDFAHLGRITQQMEAMDVEPPDDDFKRMALLDFQFHTYIWSRTGHELLEQALENIKPQAHYYMYLTRQAGRQDYAEEHRKLIDFLKHGDRSKASEVMLSHILSVAERTMAWWERRQEELFEEQ